ncbi:hypothetical protein EHS13_18530 [Paenibacillus psychroresistens]|uniref:Uncharacterized protein n=1 Tax=Paenibacillus psychroresistens TaxID=1778678 RepID=A0A6B8RMF8_9BACL|nr:hypothetical protein [Paenibacillus psychroresistens]QGQ96733.1 hypothetical protein EHS13_18530 [Paenibacillus psychroresistens]
MKSKMYAGKLGFIAMLVVTLAVMSGCGKQAASSEPASSVQANSQEAAVNSDAPKDQVMSPKELELSMLFRGLLQMDNKGELLISKEQAVSMQPIVTKSTEDGEITADNQKQLMALLTPEQKKFIDDLNARFKQFAGNRNNPDAAGGGKRPALTDEQRAEFQKNQANLTDEERKKLQEARGNRGKGQGTGTKDQGAGTDAQGDQVQGDQVQGDQVQGDQGQGQGDGQGNGGFGGGFGGFGDNVEQQLMDLLDTKINN